MATDRYKKYWIGKCKTPGGSINLDEGKLYLLKDQQGEQKYFNVSPYISNSDSFIGCYQGDKFEVLEDVTEAIKSMPHEEGVFKYEMNVGLVRMVARERNMSFIDAQLYLIGEGHIQKPVVDSDGQPLKKHKDIYQPGSEREPDFVVPKEVADKGEQRYPWTCPPSGSLRIKDPDAVITPQTPEKPPKTTTKTQPTQTKTETKAAKPKFVQKGLFG